MVIHRTQLLLCLQDPALHPGTHSLWQPQLECGHGTEQQPPEMGIICSSCEFVGWGAGFRLIGSMRALSETSYSGDILTSAAKAAVTVVLLGPENQTTAFSRELLGHLPAEAQPLLFCASTPGIISVSDRRQLPWILLLKIHAETECCYLKSTQWTSYLHLWQTC